MHSQTSPASAPEGVLPLSKNKLLTLGLLLLLTCHSFLMNGYYSSHRYLTVATYFSSIRNQLDPELFKNSIYIQAINRNNLRIGIFYDVLPHVLTWIDLETFALLHTALSLFIMLAGIYALAIAMTRSRSTAIVATLLYTTQLNNWTLGSPAPYLNFFHHGLPYTYPLIVWSMLFFFRGRYVIALLLTGISFNFHPMCTLFLLCAYSLYWLLNRRCFPLTTSLLCLLAFMLPALPGALKTINHIGSGGHGEQWLEGVRWVAGYTCNPSTWLGSQWLHAGLFLILACCCLYAFPKSAVRRSVTILWAAVALMCLAGTVFADIIPVPFIIKLSLWRSTVIFLYLAIIMIAWACMHIGRRSRAHALLAVTVIALLTGYLPQLPQAYLALLLPAFGWTLFAKRGKPAYKLNTPITVTMLSVLCLPAIVVVPNGFWVPVFMAGILMLIAVSTSARFAGTSPVLIWGLGLLAFDAAVLTSRGGPEIYYHGRLQGRTDPWAEVQFAARDISHTDDLFIVPPLCNDFYHYSQRAVLGDWAEGSTLLYLDNQFTAEWFERMHGLGWTKRHNAREGFNSLTTPAIKKVADKYGASFVVTEKPKEFDLPKAFENSRFILYRIDRNGSNQ